MRIWKLGTKGAKKKRSIFQLRPMENLERRWKTAMFEERVPCMSLDMARTDSETEVGQDGAVTNSAIGVALTSALIWSRGGSHSIHSSLSSNKQIIIEKCFQLWRWKPQHLSALLLPPNRRPATTPNAVYGGTCRVGEKWSWPAHCGRKLHWTKVDVGHHRSSSPSSLTTPYMELPDKHFNYSFPI